MPRQDAEEPSEAHGFDRVCHAHALLSIETRVSISRRIARTIVRRLMAPYWQWRFAAFGSRSSVARPALLVGAEYIEIGAGVAIWYGGRLEALRTCSAFGRIRIGDNSVIHPNVHMGAVIRIDIGRGVLVASGVYITDHDHYFGNPEVPPIANSGVIAEAVSIGDYVWLGERVMVLKGVTIGEHSIIGAGAIVTKDIPPYSIAVGAPARVVRRYSFEERRWIPLESPRK